MPAGCERSHPRPHQRRQRLWRHPHATLGVRAPPAGRIPQAAVHTARSPQPPYGPNCSGLLSGRALGSGLCLGHLGHPTLPKRKPSRTQPITSGRARRPSCGFFSRSSRTHDPVRGFACPPQWMATFLGVTTTARTRTHMHVHTRTCTGARTCTCTCTHAHARAGPSHHKQHATHGVASSLYGAGSR